ncbi:MAG: hypothetical protein K1000chlam1_00285 [Candidatus Anoxychlamydiales bacterium]|nr:hypothetical protein [Candidatus Anoxychlamydiales bacterium]
MWYSAPTIPLLNFVKDSPKNILRDMALKSDVTSSYYQKRKVHDIFSATVNKVERFIGSIIKLGIFFSGVAIYYLGIPSGLAAAGGIALSSALLIYLTQNKLRVVKDQYAKVYSFGWNHIHSLVGGCVTFTQPLSYRLVKGLY